MKIGEIIETLEKHSPDETSELGVAISQAIAILLECEGRDPRFEVPPEDATWVIVRSKRGHHYELMWIAPSFCDMGLEENEQGDQVWGVLDKWETSDIDFWWPVPKGPDYGPEQEKNKKAAAGTVGRSTENTHKNYNTLGGKHEHRDQQA